MRPSASPRSVDFLLPQELVVMSSSPPSDPTGRLPLLLLTDRGKKGQATDLAVLLRSDQPPPRHLQSSDQFFPPRRSRRLLTLRSDSRIQKRQRHRTSESAQRGAPPSRSTWRQRCSHRCTVRQHLSFYPNDS